MHLQDLHKSATRLVDGLLEDEETAKRRKYVREDINEMWEIYRENVKAGHIRSPDPVEDVDAPPAFICGQHSGLSASSSCMSRLATPSATNRQRPSSPGQEGDEGGVAPPRHRSLPGDLAAQPLGALSRGTSKGEERGRTLTRQHSLPSWPSSTLACGDASRGASLIRNSPPPWDPTVGLCLGHQDVDQRGVLLRPALRMFCWSAR